MIDRFSYACRGNLQRLANISLMQGVELCSRAISSGCTASMVQILQLTSMDSFEPLKLLQITHNTNSTLRTGKKANKNHPRRIYTTTCKLSIC